MKTKICKKCNKDKPLSEFYYTKKYKDKRSIWCKDCIDKIEIKPTYFGMNENPSRLHYTVVIKDLEYIFLRIYKIQSGDLFIDLDKITVIVPKNNIDDFIKKLYLKWNEFKEIERDDEDV